MRNVVDGVMRRVIGEETYQFPYIEAYSRYGKLHSYNCNVILIFSKVCYHTVIVFFIIYNKLVKQTH